jgi:hypothetical protein
MLADEQQVASALTQTDGAAEVSPSLMPAGINRAGSRGGNASVMVAAESFERVSALAAHCDLPLHRGLDGFKLNGGLGGPWARPESQCCARRRGPPDEAGAFEGEHHLMHAGWRDLEVPLHIGFRGRLAEDRALGVDEG